MKQVRDIGPYPTCWERLQFSYFLILIFILSICVEDKSETIQLIVYVFLQSSIDQKFK